VTFVYANNPFEGGVSSADVQIVNAASGAVLLSGSISHFTSTGSFADCKRSGGQALSTFYRFIVAGFPHSVHVVAVGYSIALPTVPTLARSVL
jgi:hypothetical protein